MDTLRGFCCKLGPVQMSNFLCAKPNCYILYMKRSLTNQLSLAVLYLGRPVILFDWACQIEQQKIAFGSYVDLLMYRF